MSNIYVIRMDKIKDDFIINAKYTKIQDDIIYLGFIKIKD